MEELNRHLRLVRVSALRAASPADLPTHRFASSVCSASVNNLQAKVDALEKSNTKLTEEVRRRTSTRSLAFAVGWPECHRDFCLPQLAVANNRIITLQEDVERVQEESSYQLETRKVSASSSLGSALRSKNDTVCSVKR